MHVGSSVCLPWPEAHASKHTRINTYAHTDTAYIRIDTHAHILDPNTHTRVIDSHCMELHDEAPCVYVLKHHALLLWKELSCCQWCFLILFTKVYQIIEQRHLQFRCQTNTMGSHYAVRRCVWLVGGGGGGGRGWGACLTSSESFFSNAAISVSLSLCMHHSLNPPPPSPCRWPFRAQPRRSPRIHSAFRLSATFEHPSSAHTDTRALSTPNLKRCQADIQLYIKCTNTHTRSHTSHVYTFIQVGNLVHTAKTLVWLRFGRRLPAGFVRSRWLRLNTDGKYWRIQKKPMLIYHFNRL